MARGGHSACPSPHLPAPASVPAGSSLVVGNARVGNGDTDFQTAVCLGQGTEVVRETIPPDNQDVNLPIMGTVTLASPLAISIDCGGFAIYTYSKRMFVTKVTSIING